MHVTATFLYQYLILDILHELIKGPFYCFQPGYDNATGEWDEYPPYINAEGLEIGSPVSNPPSHHFLI